MTYLELHAEGTRASERSAASLLSALAAEVEQGLAQRSQTRLVIRDRREQDDFDGPSARDQLLELLAQRLGRSRSALRMDLPRMQLDEQDAAWLEAAARRLAADEPLAYVAGEVDFAGLRFEVGPGVLIPRHDSEVLVWTAAKWLDRFWAEEEGTALTALDLCTGSACLAIALCQALREHQPELDLTVIATDRDATALDWARRNVERHGLEGVVRLEEADLMPSDRGLCARLVLCNPPYIAHAALRGLEPSVRDFEPLTALDGGPDGLDFYRRLAEELPPYLAADALVLVEHGERQADDVVAIFEAGAFALQERLEDLAGRPRGLVPRYAPDAQREGEEATEDG